MKCLEIKNWRKYQHYKNRRPPWIKLHSKILEDEGFLKLSDRAKLTAYQLWLLVAREGTDGMIEAWKVTRETLGMSTKPQIAELIASGFVVERVSKSASTTASVSPLYSLDSINGDMGCGEKGFPNDRKRSKFEQLSADDVLKLGKVHQMPKSSRR